MEEVHVIGKKEKTRLFDKWPDPYDRWFTTPLGALVKKFERELLLDLLRPGHGEIILDAGCGTGVFTLDLLSFGPHIIGLDIFLPMLRRAGEKARRYPFEMVLGDISNLPFPENSFDKVVSVTAFEFIADAKGALRELFRVTQRGGCVVVATLNSLSPWASGRRAEAKTGHTLFDKAVFRSPNELRFMAPVDGVMRTAIHFQKEDESHVAGEIEREGREKGLNTGAFLAARWEKS
jgi:ubiquinone/menaquinone biosynthesis C-methylase UbiE